MCRSPQRIPFAPRVSSATQFVLACLLAVIASIAALAQTATGTGSGTIVGRIFNPATQEYVRNAEIQIEGTDLITYSEEDGSYVLTSVPAGDLTLTVTYTGYDRATSRVNLTAGHTATRDFDLKGAVYRPASTAADAAIAKPGALVLGEFVVSAEREGNAKAIMEQRASLNMKSVVSADNFGDITGGNVGEFIKYLPGVVMDYNNSEATTVRISGLDASNVGVSIDGMNVASAGGANFDGGSRNFQFDQASIYGVESIEISKTATASMDADAPGGRINMRSRNAFDRRGREVTAQLTFTANTHALTFKKTPGPYEGSDYKIRPGFVFTYGESFKRRFGVQLSLGASTIYTDQAEVTNLFDYSSPARGPLINQINFRDAPKLSTRASFKLTTDYKFSPNLMASITTSGSHLDDGTNNRQAILFANIAQIAPGSHLTHLVANRTTNANTRLRLTSSRRNKLNDTISYTPKIEYKRGDFTLTASGTFSRSRSAFEDLRGGHFLGVTSQVTRMGWTAERPSTRSMAWHITQTSGRPWDEPASYLRDDAFASNVITNPQSSVNQLWVGALDAKKTLRLGLPIQLGAGYKTKLSTYDLARTGNIDWTYVGPDNNQLAASSQLPTFRSIPFDPHQGGNVTATDIPRPDPYTLFDLFTANPTHFRPDTIGNHIAQHYSSRSIKEQIDSIYLEANTRWRQVRLNGGLRYERSRTIGKVRDLIPTDKVRAAGFTAGTLPYVDYQYNYGQREKRFGASGRPFFSGGAKYSFTQATSLRVAASQSIGRPSFNNLAGVIEVDETARRVRVPNPELKPRESNKYYVTLEHHLEPAGTLSLSGFKLFVENMGTAYIDVDPASIGYEDDPEYSDYRFQKVINGNGRRRIDGVELEYSQQLVFLPGFWRGLSVFGSVARTAADAEILDHVPKSANGGVRFSNYKFNAQVRCTWTASRLDFRDAPQNEEVWHYERIMFDFSGGYKINRTYELTLTGRNILNSPIARYSNITSHLSSRAVFGPAWTLGVRGRF